MGTRGQCPACFGEDSAADEAQAIPRDYNFAADILKRNLDAGRGGKTAFIDHRGTYTYADLADRVERFGHVLRSLGIRREERMLICLLDTIDWPTAFLGAIKAGVVAVPVNTLMTEDDYTLHAHRQPRPAAWSSPTNCCRNSARRSARPEISPTSSSPARKSHDQPRFEDLLATAETEAGDGADDPRRHLLLALHLRLDRQAEGRGAHACRPETHRRSLCRADPRHHRERHLLLGGETVLRLRSRQCADISDVGRRDHRAAGATADAGSGRRSSEKARRHDFLRRADVLCRLSRQSRGA